MTTFKVGDRFVDPHIWGKNAICTVWEVSGLTVRYVTPSGYYGAFLMGFEGGSTFTKLPNFEEELELLD